MLVNFHEKITEKDDFMKHLDYDKKKRIFYSNMYFPESKYVLKMPLASCDDLGTCGQLKIEKFDLLKYSYLLYY